METRDLIRAKREQNTFTKEDLLKGDRITVSYNDGDFEIEIANTLHNIAQFIMFTAVYAKMNEDSDYGTVFYTSEFESFMNTMGYYIDLCANLDYLEELKKVLVPLQLEYEKCLFEGKKLPEYTFLMFDKYDDDKVKIVSSYEDEEN